MAETVALVSVIGTVVTSLIAQLQNSRCTHIECWGVSCDRDVAANDERVPQTKNANPPMSANTNHDLPQKI